MEYVNLYITQKRYVFDNNGNQTAEYKTPYVNGIPQAEKLIKENTYNLLNQLTDTTTYSDGTPESVVANAYNGEGYRVEKTVNGETTKYLYEYDKVVSELDESGDQTAFNIYGNNLLSRTVNVDNNKETLYYMYNNHGDVTALIDAENDTISGTYYYDSFGNIADSTGTPNNSITYAGYQYDKETGLFYVGSRYYNPEIGRFINADDTSILQATQGQLLSHNLFAYCLNNPVMYSDPSGYASTINLGWCKAIFLTPSECGIISNLLWVGVATATIIGFMLSIPTVGTGAIVAACIAFALSLGAVGMGIASYRKGYIVTYFTYSYRVYTRYGYYTAYGIGTFGGYIVW